MISPEMEPGAEFATHLELSDLFRATVNQLRTMGEFRAYPCHGRLGLLPVQDTPNGFELMVSGDSLRELEPEAAEALEVGELVGILYEESFASRTGDGGFLTEPPSCSYDIYKRGGSYLRSEMLFVSPRSTGQYATDRYEELADDLVSAGPHSNYPQHSLSERLVGMELESITGINRMTRTECAALGAIINRLGELVSK